MIKKTKGAIACGDPFTCQAGMEMYELGGNAFDAAVAAAFATFVIESSLTSAGGGGFLLAHTAQGKSTLFDFFTHTPVKKRPIRELDFFPVQFNFGTATQEFHIGMGSVAVPGNVAGLCNIHERHGKLPFREILQPAIRFGKEGYEISKFKEKCVQLVSPVIERSDEAIEIYQANGRYKEPGEFLIMQAQADFLEQLGKDGADLFYKGEIAKQIADACKNGGGYLTREDFENYRMIERAPLNFKYRGYEILTNPAPSSGGSLIAFTLKLLEKYDIARFQFGSCEHIELITKLIENTNNARSRHFDSNIHDEKLAGKFLSGEIVEQFALAQKRSINVMGNTTHVSTIDTDGNAASVTTSHGEGCGYMIPGTGVMLNNMLGEADLSPQGFHKWPENTRLSSMMSPTIMFENGNPSLVIGSGGAHRIRTAIMQVLCNVIDFKMPLREAIDAFRIHYESGHLDIEGGFNLVEIDKLNLTETNVNCWDDINIFFGGTHVVTSSKNGKLAAFGDPRRNGCGRVGKRQ
jgi:gamma-glutamyltranspeptidase/glutathione hydrolase